MTNAPDLSKFSVAEKDALILALFEQVTTAHQRIAEQDKIIAEQAERIAALEAKLERLNRPPKTPDNCSMPPSKGQKKDRAAADHDRPRRKGRPGVGRSLHPNPDRVVDATLSACPKCRARFPKAAQTPQQVYDRIELPPIKPDVTRVRLFGGGALAACTRH